MGKYTEQEDLDVEKKVDGILTDVISQLVSHFHPRSIILAGSFGRGEATIINQGGSLSFLSDCEMVLVANKYLSSRRIQNALEPVLTKGNKPQFVIRSSIALPVYSVVPLSSILWKPNLWNYDLKYGSRALYGKEYLKKMPDFSPRQIPVQEGVRLIFNRLAEALKYFPVDTDSTTPEREQTAAFWVTKIILACQDALLIAAGQYNVSSRKRNELFQENSGRNFAELRDKLPRFTSLTARATEYKLRREVYWTDISELWFNAAEISDAVIRYLLRDNMGTKFENYPELQAKYFRHPALQSVMALTRRFSAKSLVFTLPSVIRAGGPWVPLVYPAIALTYFSLARDGSVNRMMLQGARKTLSLFYRIESERDDPFEEWKYLKEEVHNLWYALGK
jgi:hypothetical protein